MSDCTCDENVMCMPCVERQRLAIAQIIAPEVDYSPQLQATLRYVRQIQELKHEITLLRVQLRHARRQSAAGVPRLTLVREPI